LGLKGFVVVVVVVVVEKTIIETALTSDGV